MARRTLLVVVVLVSVVTATSLTPVTAAEVGRGTGLRIAVADLGEIVREYARSKTEQAEIRATHGQVMERLRAMDAERQRLEKEIQGLALGSPERLERKKKAENLEQEIRTLARGADRDITERINRVQAEIYKEILEVVAEYAKEHKIDLVLKQQSPSGEESGLPAGLQMGLQTVLYQAPGLDITHDILDCLNRRYEEARKAAGHKTEPGKTPAEGAGKEPK